MWDKNLSSKQLEVTFSVKVFSFILKEFIKSWVQGADE